MAIKVLILGDSGTGKSASLRNFKPEDILVINSAGKPLPFKNHLECFKPRFEKLTQDVLDAMDKTDKKVIVVDDAQYIMSFQYMRRIKEGGWDKWNDIQGDFFNIIKACDYMPDDVVVYFLSHIQRDDEGHEKIKTMGKMLDEKITIEGLFTTVLKTAVKDGQYFFLTQNSGMDTVKSPIGMFDSYAIDNDLKYVDDKIRNYYEIGEYKTDEEMAALDQEVAKAEIQKPDADGKRRRNRNTSARSSEADTSGTVESTPATDTEKTIPDSSVPSDTQNASEQSKTRRRKAKTEQAEEVSKEEEKQPEQLGNSLKDDANFASLADAASEESAVSSEPKRRRRRRQPDTSMLDIRDDELPF